MKGAGSARGPKVQSMYGMKQAKVKTTKIPTPKLPKIGGGASKSAFGKFGFKVPK